MFIASGAVKAASCTIRVPSAMNSASTLATTWEGGRLESSTLSEIGDPLTVTDDRFANFDAHWRRHAP